jgi:hypothetical protein
MPGNGRHFMKERKDRISPAVQVEPELIYRALDSLRECLDLADYQADVVMAIRLSSNVTVVELAYAWMMTAVLVADVTEIDSMTLRSLQNKVWKGVQREFRT